MTILPTMVVFKYSLVHTIDSDIGGSLQCVTQSPSCALCGASVAWECSLVSVVPVVLAQAVVQIL